MNDTLTVHKLVAANITGSVVDATARSFPRVSSTNNSEEHRQSLHINSVSPTVIRIAHQPRKSDLDVQRSLCATDQTFARLDAQSNVISTSKATFGTQTNIPSDVTEAEWLELAYLHIGLLTENSGAVLKAIFNREK